MDAEEMGGINFSQGKVKKRISLEARTMDAEEMGGVNFIQGKVRKKYKTADIPLCSRHR